MKWANSRKKQLPLDSIIDALLRMDECFPDGQVKIERSAWKGLSTRIFDEQKQEWCKAESEPFPLLESVSVVGQYSPFLQMIWKDTLRNLFLLRSSGLLSEEKIELP